MANVIIRTMNNEFEKSQNIISRRGFLKFGSIAIAASLLPIPESVVRANSIDINLEYSSEELKTDSYLNEASTLMQTLNAVNTYSILSEDSFPDVAAILRDSDWYKEKQKKNLLTETIEKGIDQLNYTQVKNEPVQCIQWVNLLASLGYTDSPITIGTNIRCARELIPDSVLRGSSRAVVASETGGDIIADPKLKIEEIKSGNLFWKGNSKLGHVGAFLATKDAGGKRLILATDSNYKRDGKIRMFTLEDENFDEVLGSPPSKKVILVKSKH